MGDHFGLQWRTAEGESRDRLHEWLVLTREWSPLHHVEFLQFEHARALLRSGADLHLKPISTSGILPSPLERAEEILLLPVAVQSEANAGYHVASLLVRAAACAAGLWSPESHEFYPDTERLEAAMMARSLYHVFLRRMGNGGWQAVDFTHTVLSHLIKMR